MKLMDTHFIQEPKITRAPIKVVVSVYMPLTLVAKRTHILVTLKRSGNSTMAVEDTSILLSMG